MEIEETGEMIKHTTIIPAARPVPVITETDVVVVGGGTAGLAAALAAARQGAKTFIVEALGSLGGTLSNGLMETALNFSVPFMHRERRSVSGILKETLERAGVLGIDPGQSSRQGAAPPGNLLFDAETMKYVALQMAEEAGIQVLYHAMVDDVLIEDGTLRGIVIATKAGRQAILCRVAIDASGDADLAAMAGAPFQLGHPRDGHGQSVSLMFRVGGVDESRLPKDMGWWQQAFKGAVAGGELELPAHVLRPHGPASVRTLGHPSLLPGIRSVNMDILDGMDGSDPQSITRASNECRKRIMKYLAFCRRYVPGAEHCFLVDTAPLIGFRDSRRIVGDYIYTWEDFRTGHKFEDTIWASAMPMDLHDDLLVPPEDPPAIHNWGRGIPAQIPPRGDYAQIPYRVLLAQKTENLLVAGRCVSSDYFTEGAFRMVPACMATGQAAGTAAALALREGCSIRDLPVEHLQASLREQGVDLGITTQIPEPIPPAG
jgi:hypothetical protein